jgi:hypothetical protein
MTDLLKTTLSEQAASAEPPDLDLDAVVAAGDRRIRRRRVVSVVGTALVTLAVLAGGLTAARLVSPDDPPVATFAERRPTYAVGSEIHYGADVLSVAPYKISAFVQTDAGFVFVTEERGVFVAIGERVRRIKPDGTTTLLTADHRGSLVGWVETHNDNADSVVYDVAARRELVRTAIGNDFPPGGSIAISPRVVAIDGNYAYFGTLDGLYRWDVKANQGELVADVPPNAIRTVSNGQMVYQQPLTQPSTGLRLAVGPAPSDTSGRKFIGTEALLSPDARYLLTAPDHFVSSDVAWDDMRLFDVKTGEMLSLRRHDHEHLIPGQWLDNTTFSLAAYRRSSDRGAVDLLICSAQSLTCKIVAPAFSTYAFDQTPPRTLPFSLPLGTPIYLRYR